MRAVRCKVQRSKSFCYLSSVLTAYRTRDKNGEIVVMIMRSRIVISLVLLLCSVYFLYYVNTETRLETGQYNTQTTSIPLLEPQSSPSKSEEVEEVDMSPCQCRRRLAAPVSRNHSVTFQETTCSPHSFRRGRNQKVVSFSYYEKNKKLSQRRIKSGKVQRKNIHIWKYFQGLKINLDLLTKFYPGTFTLRRSWQ